MANAPHGSRGGGAMARVGLPAALGQAVSAKRGVLETENSLGYEGGAPLFGEKVKSEVTSFSGGLMCKMPSSINVFKDAYLNAIRDVIFKNRLSNFLDEFPWLTGHLGNPFAPVWFIGENPSRSRVEHIDKVSTSHSENLQWSYKFREARLFRDALTKAGLKEGDPAEDIGWNCYITNVTKEPEVVKKKK
ncbi:MAG: hypothetical protein H6852_05540 [Geminicoccaceae bacterium]|nr:hypothetical protein [Geminicoccaceae bacterium]HRY23091.1 hypothetical protein [Geminicoccaceae bacterium]